MNTNMRFFKNNLLITYNIYIENVKNMSLLKYHRKSNYMSTTLTSEF